VYNDFYGFRVKPFQLTPDPEFLYLSNAHKKALAYLTYGIEDRSGFVAITGEIGAGKTTLIRVLMQNLTKEMVVARIYNTLVTSHQFLEMVLREFELDYEKKSKTQLLDTLNDFLVTQYARKRHAVLIIDEAQNLSIPLLEEIRMLSNLETDKSKLLQIIFVGQPKLREKLNRPELEQLRQRITVSYHLPPLNRQEVEGYINHRLHLAEPTEPVNFEPDAIDEIFTFSRGVPRLVNVVCDGALLAGYVAEQRTITLAMVKETVNDLGEMEYGEEIPAVDELERAGETAEMQELKKRLTELTSRLENIDQRNRELDSKLTERPNKKSQTAGEADEELKTARETVAAERVRLETLRQQLDEERGRMDEAICRNEEKENALRGTESALLEREKSVEEREKSLRESESLLGGREESLARREESLEKERVRLFSLADDLTRREEAFTAKQRETAESSSRPAGPIPGMELQVYLLERDEKVRNASIDGMTVRGLAVKGYAGGEELLDVLRRDRGNGACPLVVIDAMESGNDLGGRLDYRGIVRVLNEEFPAVRKMIATAYPYYSLRREAMMTGVDYVMTKPDAKEMNERLFGLMFQQYLDELTFCVKKVHDQSRLFLEEWMNTEVTGLHD